MKVKAEYKAKVGVTAEGDDYYLVALLDSTDEGYGVVLGDSDTDETVVIGHGELALLIASNLFDALVVELKHMEEDRDISSVVEYIKLDFEKLASVPGEKDVKNLSEILYYVNRYSVIDPTGF